MTSDKILLHDATNGALFHVGEAITKLVHRADMDQQKGVDNGLVAAIELFAERIVRKVVSAPQTIA